MSELEVSITRSFFDRHFSTILPATLAFIGILISITQIYNQELELSYDRAQQFSQVNSKRLSNLLNFMSLYPPSKEEKMQWASLGLNEEEIKVSLKNRYVNAYELYGEPLVAVQFSELRFQNPNAFSSNKVKVTTAEEEAIFYSSKFYDIVNSPEFAHTISMLDSAYSCLDNGDCDKTVMCGFLAPLESEILMYRHSVRIEHWKGNEKHSGQVLLSSHLNNVSSSCSKK